MATATTLSAGELRQIIDLVYRRSGIALHDGKRELVQARLSKRLHQLRLETPADYLRYLEADTSGQEMTSFIDMMTTNHTSFFREAAHFAYLRDVVVPERRGVAGGATLEGWCAACSTGEEPYTIAVTLLDAGDTRFRLLASDLSSRALAQASSGVYRLDRVSSVPRPVLKKYFERGLGEQDGLARVAPSVRRLVQFQQLNLLEVGHLQRTFDFIFCRNVMIYFDLPVRQRVVAMLVRHLAPGGYLFIAHSENLTGIDHGLRRVAPSVFKRAEA